MQIIFLPDAWQYLVFLLWRFASRRGFVAYHMPACHFADASFFVLAVSKRRATYDEFLKLPLEHCCPDGAWSGKARFQKEEAG